MESHSMKSIDSLWSEADSAQMKDLPVDALRILEEIVMQADQQDLSAHKFKAYYRIYAIGREKEGGIEPLKNLMARDAGNDSEMAVLHLYQAEALVDYYTQNKWEILQRTDIASSMDNMESWTSRQFLDAIYGHLDQIQSRDLLDIPASKWEPIIEIEDTTLAPYLTTLYDVVIDRALDLLLRHNFHPDPALLDRSIPASQWFAPVDSFHQLSVDSTLRAEKVHRLLSEWLSSAQNDEREKVLSHIDFLRYDFYLKQWSGELSDEEKLNFQNQFIHLYGPSLVADRMKLQKAQYFIQIRDEKLDKLNGWMRAHNICSELIQDPFHPLVEQQAKSLLNHIEQEELQIQVEEVIVPHQNQLIYIQQRNVKRLKGEYFLLSAEQAASLRPFGNLYPNSEDMEMLKKEATRVASFEKELPKISDYASRSYEIAGPSLPSGIYLLSIHSDKLSDHLIFQVSDLSYALIDNVTMVVANRQSGLPIEGAKVSYDYRKNHRTKWQARHLFTNPQGLVEFPPASNGELIRIRSIEQGNDRFQIYQQVAQRQSYGYEERVQFSEHVLTDRTLYRQGQLLYLKGVAYQTKSVDEWRLRKNEEMDVDLVYQGKKIMTKKVLISEDGGFFTQFALPQGLLNGRYLIKTPHGSRSIQIESYRRPQFKIELAIDSTKLDHSDGQIMVYGKTISYDGHPIRNASVEYSIRVGYHYRWSHRMLPVPQSHVIHTGKVRSDAKGNFELSFSPSNEQAFNHHYYCSFKATDGRGEQILNSITIPVWPGKLKIRPNFDKAINHEDLKEAKVEFVNPYGKLVKDSFQVEIAKVQDPGGQYVKRYWSFPDSILLDGETFKKQFSTYSPVEATPAIDWPVESQIFNQTIWSDHLKLVSILPQQLAAGTYRVVIKKGGSLMDEILFSYFDTNKAIHQQDEWTLLGIPKELSKTVDYQGEIQSDYNFNAIWFADKSNEEAANTSLLNNAQEFRLLPSDQPYRNRRLGFFAFLQNRFYKADIDAEVQQGDFSITMNWEKIPDAVEAGEKIPLKIQSNKPHAQVALVVCDARLDDLLPYQWTRLHRYRPSLRLDISSQHYRSLQTRFPYRQANYGTMDLLHSLHFPKLKSLGELIRNAMIRMRMMEADASYSEEVRQEKLDDVVPQKIKEIKGELQNMIRERLAETVVFEPDLQFDKEGILEYEFLSGESITKYKVMVFAYDEEMRTGSLTAYYINTKTITTQPYLPRNLQWGDTITFSTQVRSDTKNAKLSSKCMLRDAISGKDLNHLLLSDAEVATDADSVGESLHSWKLHIDETLQSSALEICILSSASGKTDGLCTVLPIQSNVERIIESTPFYLQEGSAQPLTLDIQKEAMSADLMLEIVHNPYWYVIQSLPYLYNQQGNQAHTIIHRMFINSLSAKLIQKRPDWIRLLQQEWKDKEGAIHPLQDREKLKYQSVQATPYFSLADRSTVNLRASLMLLDPLKVDLQYQKDLEALITLQNANGGIAWSPGAKSSRYMSLYVGELLVKMRRLSVRKDEPSVMLSKQILLYLNDEVRRWVKQNLFKIQGKDQLIPNWILRVINLRSLEGLGFEEEHWELLKTNMDAHYHRYTLQDKLILAEIYLQYKDNKAQRLLESIKQNAKVNDLSFASWNFEGLRRSYHDPIRFQAKAIHLFKELGDYEFVKQLEGWLLSQKRTNQWGNDIQTVEAIHALIKGQTPSQNNVQVNSDKPIQWDQINENPWRTIYIMEDVKSLNARNLEISIDSGFAWGGIYYSYLSKKEDIQSTSSDFIDIKNTYFERSLKDDQELLMPLSEQDLKMGQTLVNRIVLTVEQSMDFVHLEIPRPPVMEPSQQISGYFYDDGIGYYQSIDDESAHYYIDHLPKGTFVFENDVLVNFNGSVSSGAIKAENLFDPSFKSNTEGKRINSYDR